MTQTLALLLDAYRDLNARKMFWLTLMVSLLVVLIFAAPGVGPEGLSILGWQAGGAGLVTSAEDLHAARKNLYLDWLFQWIGIGIWIGWVAMALAIISTASIFPEFVSGGSIDLVLSKPIGRLRLFLTKYLTGLLFVALQATAFSVASFVVIGLRGGIWAPGILLAIPIVVLVFSYLFAVSAAIGVVTRSTIAAVMLTLGFWFLLWVFNWADSQVIQQRAAVTLQMSQMQRLADHLPPPATAPGPPAADPLRQQIEQDLADLRAQEALTEKIERGARWVRTPLPKTADTIGLLSRALVHESELRRPEELPDFDPADVMSMLRVRAAISAEAEYLKRQRPVWWIVGTSLAFEAVVLAGAAWVFVRRDY